MKRALWVIPIALPLILLLAVGFSHNPNASASSALLNKPAPNFTLRTADGKVVTMRSLRGRPVVLNFWATWCPPCLTEHPNLLHAWRKYGAKGVAFVGITIRDSAAAARAYQRKHGGAWPALQDPGQRTAINYGVTEPPETFLIDRRGIVRYKATGAVATGGAITSESFDRKIERLLAGAS